MGDFKILSAQDDVVSLSLLSVEVNGDGRNPAAIGEDRNAMEPGVGLPPDRAPTGRQRALLVDDDPNQRTLLAFQLASCGWEVSTAVDGVDALEQARRSPPDAIVSDVLMPRMDGFRLCWAVRHEPALAAIPLVLVSSAYIDSADRRLALSFGARDFIVRGPQPKDFAIALDAALRAPPVERISVGESDGASEYPYRVIRQLERQIEINAILTRRLSVVETEIGLLAHSEEVLKEPAALDSVLQRMLEAYLDGAGISMGAIYLLAADRHLDCRCYVGLWNKACAPNAMSATIKGLLQRIAETGDGVEALAWHDPAWNGACRTPYEVESATLAAPLVLGGRRFGVVVVASDPARLPDERRPFVAAIAAQLSQSIGLATAMSEIVAGEERYRRIVETAEEGIWTIDLDANTTFVNKRMAAMLGYGVEEMAGKPLWLFMDPADREATAANLRRRTEGIAGQHDFKFLFRDGSPVWTIVQTNGLHDEEGHYTGILAMVTDISERKQAEAERERLQGELFHQAFYDALTGLPNRALFLNRLEHAIAGAGRRPPSIAVLFVDLDHFKLVNDSLGHDAGDELLKIVAPRLTSCIRPEDTVARLGGDEFTVLLQETDEHRSVQVANRILEKLSLPVMIQGQEVFPNASIGIALRTDVEETADDLLRNADLAMYKAKAAGRGRFALFDPSMSAEALGRLQLEAELRRAVERREFRVFYQPIVSIADGSIVELEALVRWEHPQRGLVSPDDFIPLAEETGLIVPIGEWVLRQACRQVVVWDRERSAANALTISVNLSARQFQHLTLVETVRTVLHETGLAPERLKLEVTESAAMDNPANTARILKGLKALGVQLAIDDFGTGYSSLGYLKAFPIDTLKVDRSFVEGLPHDERAVALVRGVVALAKGLHLTVTGEGIETAEQLASLQESGCDLGQGFLYGKPLPAEYVGPVLAAPPFAVDSHQYELGRSSTLPAPSNEHHDHLGVVAGRPSGSKQISMEAGAAPDRGTAEATSGRPCAEQMRGSAHDISE